MTKRLAVVGMGKMGTAIADLAPHRGWLVAARLDEADVKRGLSRAALGDADVAVEFTVPEAAPANIRTIVAAGMPVVVGTTGWYDQYDAIKRDVESQNGAMFTATNFSIGVNIFEQIAIVAAKLLGRTHAFDAHITETHHAAKKDAPSGTAKSLEAAVRAAWGRGAAIPVTSVRTGSVPGTHEILFDSPFEQIHIEHVARDRRVFAEGALVAAAWLIGRHGVYGMRDLLGPNESGTTS
jgi:4-hydroxy-tetrahydrodipicolinate reductase